MLKEQLQKDIDLEAKAEAKKLTARVPIFRHGYEAGWYDAGDKYATLWQAAEEKAAKYEKALKYISTFNLTSEVDELDLSDAECGYNAIIETAREALTPKTGEDGR